MTYTAHDWNHHAVAESETLRRFLEEMDAQVAAGGGFTPAGTNAEIRASAQVGVTAGAGGNTTLHVTAASPPSWLDANGNILEPGLYCSFVSIGRNAGPTTAGKFLGWSSPFGGKRLVSVDALRVMVWKEQDVVSLAASDLPFSCDAIITCEADATASFTVLVGVDKL